VWPQKRVAAACSRQRAWLYLAVSRYWGSYSLGSDSQATMILLYPMILLCPCSRYSRRRNRLNQPQTLHHLLIHQLDPPPCRWHRHRPVQPCRPGQCHNLKRFRRCRCHRLPCLPLNPLHRLPCRHRYHHSHLHHCPTNLHLHHSHRRYLHLHHSHRRYRHRRRNPLYLRPFTIRCT